MPFRRFRYQKPPWWPEDQPWPPTGPNAFPWRRRRNFLFLRVGLLFLLLFAVLSSVGGFFIYALFSPVFRLLPFTHRFGWVPVIVLLVFLLVGLTTFVRSFRRISRPFDELKDAAQRVAEGDYGVRISERGPRELRALSGSFNTMAARLQAHDQLRRSLLADITHELRTPLTIMQGNLEGMLDGIYPADEAHLRPLLEETHILSRLVDDLRTLSLAESGALKLQKEPLDIGELLGETADAFRAQADQAGIQLLVETQPGLPQIELDKERMKQILSNLVANALRYTPQGQAIKLRGFDEPGAVILEVSDTGAGIPAEYLPNIFDRFYKTRDSGGLGLGLAIARSLVTAQGGEISVRSEAGKGATFTIRLPEDA